METKAYNHFKNEILDNLATIQPENFAISGSEVIYTDGRTEYTDASGNTYEFDYWANGVQEWDYGDGYNYPAYTNLRDIAIDGYGIVVYDSEGNEIEDDFDIKELLYRLNNR